MINSLDFKDISLISRHVSTITSRDQCDTSTNICGYKLKTPILSSPMKDVIDINVANYIVEHGGLPVLHRFKTLEDQIKEYKIFKAYSLDCVPSIGINDDAFARFMKLCIEEGCKTICLDVALGASTNVEKFIRLIEKESTSVKLIVGNVCSGEQFKWLSELPFVKAIRVGVGNGKNCRTTNVTGIYMPLVTLLEECVRFRSNDVAIILDGGIVEPSDYCKAISLGADAVMMGSLIANTNQSPAQKIKVDGKKYTLVSGSASLENQKFYKNVPRYIEGATRMIDYKEECISELFKRFQEGLRSSMSYMNAKTLSEYRSNMEYVIL